MQQINKDMLNRAVTTNHNQNSQSGQNKTALMVWLWGSMTQIYGQKWIRDYGEVPTSIWTQAIGKLSDADVKGGVAECVKRQLEWPPSLPEFVGMCKQAGVDWEEAFNRTIQRRPAQSRVETLTRQECGYEIRCNLKAKDAKRLFREVYLKYTQREKEGTLPAEDTLMLTEHSSVSFAEREVNNYRLSGKRHKLQDRIEKMLKQKKENNN